MSDGSIGSDRYTEDELIPISALQHLLFCERQAALIHVERLWAENELTAAGRQLHQRADSGKRELLRGRQKGVRVERTVPLRSFRLGLWGKADVVEFHPKVSASSDTNRGTQAAGGRAVDIDASRRPVPVEYKRGRPKRGREDEVQLAAQAMCLEEMLGVPVTEAFLFYGQTRQRVLVPIDESLRRRTAEAAARMHELIATGRTPLVSYQSKCKRCSLLQLCQPASIGRVKGQRRSAIEFAQRAVAAALESEI